MTNYDIQNIFARIIRGDLSSVKIFEDEEMVIIKDAYPDPLWGIHLLCLPKKNIVSLSEFFESTEVSDIGYFFKRIHDILRKIGIKSYQVLVNNGSDAGQEVMHLHFHIKSNDKINIDIH